MKRKFVFAALVTLLLFTIYTLAQLIIGVIQTYLYKPQFSPGDLVLQSEVSFGAVMHGSPLVLIGSYCMITLIIFALLMLKKERRVHN